MAKYSLIGIDGNAFSIMGYTARAMQKEGFSEEEINAMYDEAKAGNYYHLVAVCNSYVRAVNERVERNED